MNLSEKLLAIAAMYDVLGAMHEEEYRKHKIRRRDLRRIGPLYKLIADDIRKAVRSDDVAKAKSTATPASPVKLFA